MKLCLQESCDGVDIGLGFHRLVMFVCVVGFVFGLDYVLRSGD